MSERDEWESPAPTVVETLRTISHADRATLLHAAELLEGEASSVDERKAGSIALKYKADLLATARALRQIVPERGER